MDLSFFDHGESICNDSFLSLNWVPEVMNDLEDKDILAAFLSLSFLPLSHYYSPNSIAHVDRGPLIIAIFVSYAAVFGIFLQNVIFRFRIFGLHDIFLDQHWLRARVLIRVHLDKVWTNLECLLWLLNVQRMHVLLSSITRPTALSNFTETAESVLGRL